jgi:radical SAM protein (TIGR01212 family)
LEYPWGHKRRFNSYTEYIRRTFGGRVQKVVVDAGFTCPNRDGLKGTGGCTYCDNDAFNPSEKFLVYFQPYSNTYAPLETLKPLYERALEYPGVIGLVIGTRPDCVDEAKLDYLKKLSERFFIQVEYGIESCNDRTLRHINRGHTFAESAEMILRTHERGIRTGAHMIFGLPGESEEEMLSEAEMLSSLSIDTIKFHQLQIVKGTTMEREYLADASGFVQFTMEEYIRFIVSFIERLNPGIVIERFSGEVPPRLLNHVSWDLIRYDEVLRLIEKELERRDTWQGKYFRSG